MTRIRVLQALRTALEATPDGVRRDIAAELLETVLDLRGRVDAIERRLTDLVQRRAPRLLDLPGVGVLTAAKIIGEAAGISRFRTPAAFAMHARCRPHPRLDREPCPSPAQPRRQPPDQRRAAPHRGHPDAGSRPST